MVPAAWCMAPGTPYVVPQAANMGPGTPHMVPQTSKMALEVPHIVSEALNMVLETFFKTCAKFHQNQLENGQFNIKKIRKSLILGPMTSSKPHPPTYKNVIKTINFTIDIYFVQIKGVLSPFSPNFRFFSFLLL